MSKIAFVYPGQGTQSVGMGKELYSKCENEMNDLFNSLDYDLKTIMFEGPENELNNTKNAQPAIVIYSVILTKKLLEKGINPDFVAGHSLGEYTSLYASGILSIEDIAKLASKRGEIMSEANIEGTMSAIIGLSSEKILELCKNSSGVVEAVNFNEPNQTVIAGEKKAIEEITPLLETSGARRIVPLSVSGPFHSSLMKPVAEILKKEFDNYEWKENKVCIVANTTAEILNDTDSIKKELYNQTFGPVKWVDTINKMKENGVTKIYEIGPGNVLKGLIRKIDKEMEVVSISSLEELENI